MRITDLQYPHLEGSGPTCSLSWQETLEGHYMSRGVYLVFGWPYTVMLTAQGQPQFPHSFPKSTPFLSVTGIQSQVKPVCDSTGWQRLLALMWEST